MLAAEYEPCPGWLYNSRFDACYTTANSTEWYTWDEARTGCMNLNGSGDLLTLDQKGEDKFIYDNFWKTFDTWVGARFGASVSFFILNFSFYSISGSINFIKTNI